MGMFILAGAQVWAGRADREQSCLCTEPALALWALLHPAGRGTDLALECGLPVGATEGSVPSPGGGIAWREERPQGVETLRPFWMSEL